MGIKNSLLSIFRYRNFDIRILNNRLADLNARHKEVSAILSLDDETSSPPTPRLFKIFSELIIESPQFNLKNYSGRKHVPNYINQCPGEHYKVIAALINIINAESFIEIGTFTGHGTIAATHSKKKDTKIYTVDIIPYNKFKNSILEDSDFSNYSITQIISNWQNFDQIKEYVNIIKEADIIFCDGPKNIVFEKELLNNFQKIGLKNGCILMFDDIKQWNMLKIWRDIKMPKLDITSIGHFTGTGIIEWNDKMNIF